MNGHVYKKHSREQMADATSNLLGNTLGSSRVSFQGQRDCGLEFQACSGGKKWEVALL